MITANISKTKNELSRYLDAVRGGETILILDRARPIARIEPISATDGFGNAARVSELEALGLITCNANAKKDWSKKLHLVGGSGKEHVGSVEALLEERASER